MTGAGSLAFVVVVAVVPMGELGGVGVLDDIARRANSPIGPIVTVGFGGMMLDAIGFNVVGPVDDCTAVGVLNFKIGSSGALFDQPASAAAGGFVGPVGVPDRLKLGPPVTFSREMG